MPSGTFQKKLAGAQSRQSEKRKKIFGFGALAIVVVLLVSVFAYFGVQFYSYQAKLQEAGLSSLLQLGGEDSQLATMLQSENIAVTQLDENAVSDAEGQAFREQFVQQLVQYESEIEPVIDELWLDNWASEKQAELNQLKEDAIEYFSTSEYLLARERLQQARAMALAVSAEYVSRLATAKREAHAAFGNDQAPEAGKAIQQALRLNPVDSEMLALQKRVDVLPQVLELLRQASVAQTENRSEKEIVALQKALSIDSSRKWIPARLEKLRAQSKQQQFSSVVSKIQDALNAGNLADAEKQIAIAKTIFPASQSSTTLEPLQNRLQEIQTEREFVEQMALGEQAGQRDDWQAATENFGRAQKLKPNNKAAIDNYYATQEIVSITQKISDLLAREQRLGDKNILDSAAEYLSEVEFIVGASPRLQKIHAELVHKVDLYKTEVDVVVVSDNETHIVVRGVGKVGKTSRRTIRLRPGKRVFEGSRAGYKSKLVTLDITPGALVAEVTVVCDEKI